MAENEEGDWVSPNVILNQAGKVIRDIIVREFAENGGKYEKFTADGGGTMKQPDAVLDAMESVIGMIKDGKSIEPQQERIRQLIDNQNERAQLIDSLQLTHEYERLVKFLRARKCVEDVLLQVAENGQLSPAEALAFHSILGKEVKDMQKRVGIGAMGIQDILGLLNKVDWVVQSNEKKLQKDFTNTNPQGREIIRKVSTNLQKILSKAKADHGSVGD